MPEPAHDWFDRLPARRCLAEVSMWSADLAALGAETERMSAFADMLHIDVADGVFAPALLFFPDLVAAIRRRTALPIHVHLMVDDRLLIDQARQFVAAGADLVSVHAECAAAAEAMAAIEAEGALAGLVLKVDTPVEAARALLARARMLTLLGTAIGVKGQTLSQEAPGRLEAVRHMLARAGGRRVIVAADGAIRAHTVPALVGAGAGSVVMGSLAFDAPDLAALKAWLAGQKPA